MCDVVYREFIDGTEESCWGCRARCVATGVYVCFMTYCLISEVESVLVVFMVEVTEEGGFGIKSSGSVKAVVSTTWNWA